MRITESDLVIPALYLISVNPGVNTSTIIQELTDLFQPTGEDAKILSGRSDTKFSQLVRNLVSHKTLEKEGYAILLEQEERRLGQRFDITEKGKAHLEDNQDIIDNLLLHGFPYETIVATIQRVSQVKTSGKKILLVKEDIVIREGKRQTKTSTAYQRSDAVRKAAIDHYRRKKDGHIVCTICGFDFFEIYGIRGKDFIEIHHEKPLYETEGEERKAFLSEAINDVKPVCSNCHRIIHKEKKCMLSIVEMKQIMNEQHRFLQR